MTNLKFYSCSHKNVQSDRIYVSVGIEGLSHVQSVGGEDMDKRKVAHFLLAHGVSIFLEVLLDGCSKPFR